MGKNVVIVAALLAAGFFAAWLRFRPHLGLEAAYTDGVRTYDSVAAEGIRFAVWDDALPLPESVNGETREQRPAISPDGRYLVFAAGEAGLNSDLYLADLDGGEPTGARPVWSLNSDFDELSPAFGHDALWFASNRPGGEGGLDLWRASYRDGVFGEPEPVGGGLNTGAEESDPAPLPGTRALAFASDREGSWDLFLARPPAGSPEDPEGEADVERLEAVSSPFEDREPAFTSDGLAVVFASDRPLDGGDSRDWNLWRSVLEDGAWVEPDAIDGVNGPADERGPLLSRDGFTLYFSVEDEGRDADLFRAHSRELLRIPGRPVGWMDLVILGSLLVAALLAWLAKRWKQLEVLYKCFVVSAAAHLALLLWFQHVGVEGGPVDLPGRSALFQVRLAVAPSEPNRALESREGRLETSRSEVPDVAEPEREAVAAERPSAPAPAAVSVARAEAPPVDVPDASTVPREPDRPARREPNVELTDAEQPAARREGAARPLEVAASALDVARAEAPVASPARADAAPDARGARDAERPPGLAIAPRELLAERRTESEPALPSRWESTVTAGPRRAARSEDVAVAQPSDRTDVRREAAARDLALPEPTAGPAPERAAPEVERIARARLAPERAAGPAPAPPPPVALAAPAEPPRPAPLERARPEPAPRREATTEVAFVERADPTRESREDAPDGERDARPRELVVEAAAVGVRRPEPELRPRRFDPRDAAPIEAAPRAAALTAERAADDVPTERVARRLDTTPYRSRFGLEKEEALREYGGGVETEAAVADGLAYLASIQHADGFWGPGRRAIDEKYFEVGVGKTALCLLAFLGAGHTPVSRTEHSDVVARAVDWLVDTQDPKSGHFGYSTSYSHGVTTYALAECYALTGERRLKRPLERAVQRIVEKQWRGDGKLDGGWGYYYPDGRTYDAWPRVSVSSWQVMALESARIGGLAVPDETFAAARAFLRQSYDDRGWFRYSHDPERLGSGYPTLPGSTPAGLFALSLLGERLTDDRWRDAVAFVTSRAPDGYRYTSDDAFVFRAQGNLYFWYYGSLAMFRHGGAAWERWNTAMKETLLGEQESDGSWRPISIYAEYAGDDEETDRSYTTAMCVLTLEVYYRYFTPLLKVE